MNPSLPRVLIHLEGLLVLALATFAYFSFGGPLLLFLLLLLAPDVSLIPYLLKNNKVGSAVYNLFHTYSVPLALGAIGYLIDANLMLQIALIWTAHIGMDRAIGFGLKYPDQFKMSHIQRV